LLRSHLLLFLPFGWLVCAQWIGVSAWEVSLSLQTASASTCIALAFLCHLLICDFGLLVGPRLSSWHLTVRDIRWCVTDGSLLWAVEKHINKGERGAGCCCLCSRLVCVVWCGVWSTCQAAWVCFSHVCYFCCTSGYRMAEWINDVVACV